MPVAAPSPRSQAAAWQQELAPTRALMLVPEEVQEPEQVSSIDQSARQVSLVLVPALVPELLRLAQMPLRRPVLGQAHQLALAPGHQKVLVQMPRPELVHHQARQHWPEPALVQALGLQPASRAA
eukprot:SRR837773.27026.p2 GENE.SRR837773.27026~~SRR837773.27026.p2  ORF type:complete len:125 (-),score=14.95 SRR837773.27026:80-454(-)